MGCCSSKPSKPSDDQLGQAYPVYQQQQIPQYPQTPQTLQPPPYYAGPSYYAEQQPPPPPTEQSLFSVVTPFLPSAPAFEVFNFAKGVEKEPMLLLDTTGSMTFTISETSKTRRNDTVQEAIGLIVEQLGREDSQAANEEHGGGLRTITFAGGSAIDIDDLNPRNLRQKWDEIKWEGTTFIMPGWIALQSAYLEEFGQRAVQDRPILLALIITDGDAKDITAFTSALANDHNSYCVIALLGYGQEHDAAYRSFMGVANQNNRVKIIPFEGNTNPAVIAETLLKMIE